MSDDIENIEQLKQEYARQVIEHTLRQWNALNKPALELNGDEDPVEAFKALSIQENSARSAKPAPEPSQGQSSELSDTSADSTEQSVTKSQSED